MPIYLLLLLVVDYRVAYTGAYAAGLVGGYLMHARFVFGARPGVRSARELPRDPSGDVSRLAGRGLCRGRPASAVPKPLGMLAALAFTVPASLRAAPLGIRRPTERTGR